METKKKYLAQKDKFSCGVYAIANVLIHLGVPLTEEDIPEMREFCNCKEPLGMMPWDMSHVLIQLATRTKLFELEAFLEGEDANHFVMKELTLSGRLIILNYYSYTNWENKIRSHYVAILYDEDRWRLPNQYNGIADIACGGLFSFESTMTSFFSKEKVGLHPLPQAWVLKPKAHPT